MALSEGELAEEQERFEATVAVSRSMSAHLATPALLGLAAVARENGDLDREGALLSEAAAAAGSEPSITRTQSLRKERAEYLRARGDVTARQWRATHLWATLAPWLGPDGSAEEEATGVALGDEAALKFALTSR